MKHRRLPQTEFIVLSAMMFATIAFSIDAMLPALSLIGATLTPDNPSRASLIISTFVLGMGIGTLFSGPLADAFGRRKVIVGGMALYAISALVAAWSNSIEMLLIARVFQGLGAAGPRIATLAMIRDLYKGAEMARISSFVMMVFILVPAVGPLIGQGILMTFNWQTIFFSFVVFALFGTSWMFLRQAETLAPDVARPFSFTAIWDAAKEIMGMRVVVISIFSQMMAFTALFAMISTIQPIFDITYDRAHSFPLWFGASALFSGSANFLNARFVREYGMRRLITFGFSGQLLISTIALIALSTTGLPFLGFFAWLAAVFFLTGFTLGNLNALAMEPVPHIAGTASSIIGAISTVGAAIIAGLVALSFTDTAMPLVICGFICSGVACLLMWILGRRAPLAEAA